MKNYLGLLRHVISNGTRQTNRTGVDTIATIGETLRFDLRDGFPAPTTKKLAWKQVVGELIGFMRGYTNAADFRALGCTIWDGNANEDGVDLQGNVVPNAWLKNPNRIGPDDLGRVYGAQWRGWTHWEDYDGDITPRFVDQLTTALDTIRNNPDSRRIIVTAWNPAELDQMALPPCHMMFQFLPRSDGTLHMVVTMRSVDVFLGMPFNIASYALMLHLFAAWTGRTAATLTMNYADTHVYVNHLDQAEEQLSRTPGPKPKLVMEVPTGAHTMHLATLLSILQPEHLELVEYNPQPAIKAPMAV